jgi:hypothetical protein
MITLLHHTRYLKYIFLFLNIVVYYKISTRILLYEK